jgi:hypothetical protein
MCSVIEVGDIELPLEGRQNLAIEAPSRFPDLRGLE